MTRLAAGESLIHIHPQAPPKPAVGAPCNGCGVCCLVEPCPLGVLLSRRTHGACRALRWGGAGWGYVCGAVAHPLEVWPRFFHWAAPVLARWARRWIAAGQGCDAALLTRDTSTSSPHH